LVVTVGHGQPFLRGSSIAETLAAMVSGLIKEANFCMVWFFHHGERRGPRAGADEERRVCKMARVRPDFPNLGGSGILPA
jgi:hypothetical protein